MVTTLLTNAAETNRGVFRYIVEATWGTTPATGTVKTMRITSSNLEAKKTTKDSAEIRPDRMVSAIIEVAGETTGDAMWEFSAGGQDDLIAQFLLSSFSQPMNFFAVSGVSVSTATSSKIRVAGVDWTAWLTNSQYLKLEGFANFANNGYFKIASFAFTGGNTDITTVETSLVVEAGSFYTRVQDANDVFSKSTGTQLQAANTVLSGVTLPVNLAVGQKVYLEGLGKEQSTIVCTATPPTENDKFTIFDGVQTVRFEIATVQATVTSGNVWVPLSATSTVLATNIAAAIMDQFKKQNFRISATVTASTVTITNHRGTGSVVTEVLTTLTTTAPSGGDLTQFGLFTVATIVDTTHFTTVETLGVNANATTLTVIIKGSHVRNQPLTANIVKQSVSAETGFTDVGKFLSHNGLRVGTFKLNVQPGAIVTGGFTFMGRATAGLATSVLGLAPYVVLPVTVETPLNSTSQVTNVLRNGVAMTTAILKLDVAGNNTLRNQPAVGAKFPAGIGYGRFTLTGTFDAYFQNLDLYNDFINHTTASIAWSFEDLDHNTYFFTIPAIKYLTDAPALTGIDKDVTETVGFTAFRDPVLGTMLMIDRFSSVYPMSTP